MRNRSELLPVDLRHGLWVECLAWLDPQGLVHRQQRLIVIVLRIEGGVIEDKLHDLQQVVLEDIEIGAAKRRKLGLVPPDVQVSLYTRRCLPRHKLDFSGILVQVVRQSQQTCLAHGREVALEAGRLVGVGHHAYHRRPEIAGQLHDTIDARHRSAPVALGPLRVEEDAGGLVKVSPSRRHGDIHVVIVGCDHQRYVLRVE